MKTPRWYGAFFCWCARGAPEPSCVGTSPYTLSCLGLRQQDVQASIKKTPGRELAFSRGDSRRGGALLSCLGRSPSRHLKNRRQSPPPALYFFFFAAFFFGSRLAFTSSGKSSSSGACSLDSTVNDAWIIALYRLLASLRLAIFS